MTTTTEDASPAAPARTGYPGLGAALGVGGLGLLLAQLDGVARTGGVLLLVVAFAAQLGADAVARVLAALPPVLRELPRSRAGNGSGVRPAPRESRKRQAGDRLSRPGR